MQHEQDVYGRVIQQHVEERYPTFWWMNEVDFWGKIQRMRKSFFFQRKLPANSELRGESKRGATAPLTRMRGSRLARAERRKNLKKKINSL